MDTTLSDSELAKAKRRFKEFDVDGDGTVSWDDYKQYLMNKKQNQLYGKLQQKQKHLLSMYNDAMRRYRSGDESGESNGTPPTKKKTPAKKKKATPKKPQRQLTEEEQKELASLDPFAPGHTEEEKARIWERINQLVGEESEDDDDDEDVEHVSFSEEEGSEDKDEDEDEETEKKTQRSPKAKSKTPTASRKSSGGAADEGVWQGMKRSLSHKPKRGAVDKEPDSVKAARDTIAKQASSPAITTTAPSPKSPRGAKPKPKPKSKESSGGEEEEKKSRDDNDDDDDGGGHTTRNAHKDSDGEEKPREREKSISSKSSDSEDSGTGTPRKTLLELRKSASARVANVSKKGSRVMSGVIKKAEEGAKHAKSKLLKEQIQEEPVEDPDDPQMFADAYKKNH